MKDKIHPKYEKAVVTCACGNTFETGSTAKKLEVEVCSACHPFYTGKQKYVDTAGRVDRFKEMQEKADKMKKEIKGKAKKPKASKTKKAETKKSKPTPKKKSASKKTAKPKTKPNTKKKKS